MHCEVKTIHKSDDELERMAAGGVGSTTRTVDPKLLDKITSTLIQAKAQLDAFAPAKGARSVAFVIVNFDDWPSEYKEDYYAQIDEHLGQNRTADLDVVFFNQRTAYPAAISMRNAAVVNEPQ